MHLSFLLPVAFLTSIPASAAIPGPFSGFVPAVIDQFRAPSLLYNALLESSFFDFWRSAESLGKNLTIYTENTLHKAALDNAAAANKISEFKNSLAEMLAAVGEYKDDVQQAIEARGLNMSHFSEKLSNELSFVFEDLKHELSVPLPKEMSARQAERARIISLALSKAEIAFIKVSLPLGIEEDVSRTRFELIKPRIEAFLFVAGEICDNHPMLVEIVLFSGAALLIPESWLLRPLLSLFGFSPIGPVKGTSAAWLQSRFWGGVVAKKSWFARLQQAGMKVIPPGTGKKVAGSIGLGLGIVGTMFGCKH